MICAQGILFGLYLGWGRKIFKKKKNRNEVVFADFTKDVILQLHEHSYISIVIYLFFRSWFFFFLDSSHAHENEILIKWQHYVGKILGLLPS